MIRFLPSEPRRILIVRLGAIGDVARVLPMLAGLKARFPEAEVDWVVQSKAADLLRGHPEIARLWVVPFRSWRDAFGREAWRLRRWMRSRGYDLVLDFQGMIKGAVWAVAAGGPAVRVGWGPGHAQNLAWLWYHGLRTPPGRRVNRHLRHRALVDWLGTPDLPATPLPAPPDARPVEAFSAELAARPRPWILAWPGSSRSGSHKRWDPERMAAAVREIRERTGGTVIVGWGPAEEEARALAAAVPSARTIPPLTLPQLALLLARCDLYVGMDSGPMHVAALLGTPTVGVFGRSDPEIHGPAGHLAARVVAQRLRAEPVIGARTREECVGQLEDVLTAVAQRRKREDEHRQTVIEILAESAIAYGGREVGVGGRDDEDVNRVRPGAAEPPHLVTLEHGEQLPLQLHGQESDLVEEERAHIGRLDQPDPGLPGVGEGPALEAEQLRFDERGRNGCAVQIDEGPRRSGTDLMDGPGE